MGTLRRRSEKTVEILESMSVDIFCIQETGFRGQSLETAFKGQSVRMTSGKAAEYELFWRGNY